MNKSSKNAKLKGIVNIFLVMGCIIAFLFTGMYSENESQRTSNETTKKADGYTIENYKVVMIVKDNYSIDVKEFITVNFYERGHHGIYKFIPEWLEYTGKDNKTISRKATIRYLKAYGDEYKTTTENGKPQIKLGSANETLPLGPHTYIIGYTYDMGGDYYDDFDEFIFHAFGDFWGTRINNASVEIHFPKTIDVNNKIHFYADKYRKKDITSEIDYYVVDNTLFASVPSYYSLNKALTIDLELPNGFFKGGSDNYGNVSLILCIICISFAIITFILWLGYGKDLPKAPATVEFYPPENMDAAQIGYIYKKDSGKKLSIALIIELASKGLIRIDESEDKKKITISKSSYTNIDKLINREIKISKVKDIKSGFKLFLTAQEAKNYNLMNKYFKDSDEHTITSNFDEFYERADDLIKNNYIKVESDTINKYSKDELEELKKSQKNDEVKEMPKMTPNEELVYNQLFEDGDETVLSENHSFSNVFYKVAENVKNELNDKMFDYKAYKIMLITSIGFTVCVILWVIAFFFVEDLNTKLMPLYSWANLSNIAIFILTLLMKKKTTYGEDISAKVNGFRKYLELAEKNQIDMYVKENPNYFYDILPYAYVLDVSKKWIKKFENIPEPINDMGDFNYYSTDSLNVLSSSIYSSSSGSSSGGGCSSCGGGCSSCGGGGSW